jgi:hypothetical protein
MSFESIPQLALAAITVAFPAAIGAFARRGNETGFPIYERLPPALAVMGGMALVTYFAGNTNLALTLLLLGAMFAVAALGCWLVDEQSERGYIAAMLGVPVAVFLVLLSDQYAYPVVLASLLATFSGAVLAPFNDRDREGEFA